MVCYPWKQLYLIAFVDLVPVATENVSIIRSNIVWKRWKTTLRARSIIACEQAPVGDSQVQSRANGMNRQRSGEEGLRRGACRHSIDAAVP